jgi:hypothetical protein
MCPVNARNIIGNGWLYSHIKLSGCDTLIHALDDFLGDPIRGLAMGKYHNEERTQ